jgi:hypothetical protein
MRYSMNSTGGDHEKTDRTGSNPGADHSGTGVGPVGADVRGVTVPRVLREVGLPHEIGENDYIELPKEVRALYGAIHEDETPTLERCFRLRPDLGIAAALDVVAKARLEREWEA